jgi:dipeptidyl aminopeptidase/acylaminoacyl peptidase
MSAQSAVARAARLLVYVSAVALVVIPGPSLRAQNGGAAQGSSNGAAATPVEPNYGLAAQWTSQKIGKLVFDTTVNARWLEKSDRFWYAYETREGRRFYFVDATKKAKTPLFDHARMAAVLTTITRIPYDSQHLPFEAVRFVKNDTAFEFDVRVPADANIVTTKPRTTTTDQQGGVKGGGGDEDEALADEAQSGRQQTGQRGQGQRGQQQGGRGASAAAGPRNRTLIFEYDLATASVTLLEDRRPEPRPLRWASFSPDKKTIVFARNHNLYMMDAENFEKARKNPNEASIVETQLTKDGEEYYSYARAGGGTREEEQQQQQQQQQEQREEIEQEQREEGDAKNLRVAPVNIVWSRDSSKFALVRRDTRKVKDLWVINALSTPRPTLEAYRYSMPGEEHVPQNEMYVFDVASKAGVRMKVDRFKDQSIAIATKPQRPGTGGGRGGGGGGNNNQTPQIPAEWLSDSNGKLYLTRQSRDLHRLDVCLADPATGEVKTLVEERLNTYIETKPLRLVNGGTDMIFWSERDGWAHFYLYDANTGVLKNRITDGEYVTTAIENIDDKLKVLYFSAAGREKGEDPYYTHMYRVGYDGSGIKLLNSGNASHSVIVSDSTRFFVNNMSRVDGAPEAVLYDTLGTVVTKLESPDLDPLLAIGFKFPEPFTVKADDGITDLYGVMYKPFDFDPHRKYPIIAYVYPGPQTESVTKTFNPRSNNISLAQFGFIVIEVGNRGGHPTRSKWYHNYGYGNLRDYGLADKKAAIEELAKRYPYIDINRVGIWGHSGGGFMTAAAMLVYPDFFKVGWSESGNHENNIYNNTWSEKHHGIKEIEKDGQITFEYDIEKNSELAKNLKGNLMLITGDIDNNVHPAGTYRLADALIKANKRFDMFVLPGVRHSFQPVSNYVSWLRGDYFARHLLGKAATSIDIVEMNREAEQTGSGSGSGRRGGGGSR